jgi:hypothetical protein
MVMLKAHELSTASFHFKKKQMEVQLFDSVSLKTMFVHKNGTACFKNISICLNTNLYP